MLSSVTALVVGLLVAPALLAGDTLEAHRLLKQVARSSTLESNLRVLCDEIGPRLPGTPAMSLAENWARETLDAAGVDEVRLEPFTVPNSWREIKTTAEIVEPTQFSVPAVSAAWAPSTSPQDMEAEVIDGGFGTGGVVLRLGQKAAGKIVLIRSREAKSFEDLGIAQRQATLALREAEKVGAAAVVLMSTRPRGLLYRHVNVLKGEIEKVPNALLAREDALRMARLLDADKHVRMRLSVRNETGGTFTAHNVVAKIRGAEPGLGQVIVGAHLDSWDLGTGCLDNASNVALVIEMARAMASGRSRPRRTVTFVLFGAEEQGLLGSWAYARAHRDQLDSVSAVIIHDMGVGGIKGYSLGGRRDLEDGLVEAMAPVESRGANAHSYGVFFGTDHFDFLLEGVPTLLAIQDMTDYVPNYHSAADTFDKVDLAELRSQTGIAAVTVYNIANHPEPLGKRLNRREVKRLLEETRMDEQLKFLGLWEDFAQGRRGRRPGE